MICQAQDVDLSDPAFAQSCQNGDESDQNIQNILYLFLDYPKEHKNMELGGVNFERCTLATLHPGLGIPL